MKYHLFLSCSLFMMVSSSFAVGISKNEVLGQLIKTQTRVSEKMTVADQKLLQTLNSTLSVEPTPSRIHALDQLLEQLLSHKKELMLEQRFYDQLIFRIEKSYTGNDLKEFLVQTLLMMAQNETLLANQETNLSLIKYLTYLAIALRALPEPNENLLSFLESYTEFSTIQHPRTPTEFVNQRNYTNGILTEVASPVSREEAGNPSIGVAPSPIPIPAQPTTASTASVASGTESSKPSTTTQE